VMIMFTIHQETPSKTQGRQFTYDAENKQVSVSDSNGTIGAYSYDGDGKRVKKYVPSTGKTTIFVYDASGKLIAEYSTTVASTNDAKVNYLTSDHLGSPRINTNQNGAVISRHDYHPFGEEIFGLGGRTTALGYTADTIRKQFTGYERDTETGLDFAQARYYTKNQGRFTTADPLYYTASRPSDPQQFNLYAYVGNNPLTLIDPNGKDAVGTSVNGQGQIGSLTEDDRKKLEDDLKTIAPGTKVLADGTVKKPGFWKRVANRLSGHGKGTDLVGRLVDAKNTTTIVVTTLSDNGTAAGNAAAANIGSLGGKTDAFVTAAKRGIPTDAIVVWNPQQTAEAGEFTTTGGFQTQLSSASNLAHELIHAEHLVSGNWSLGLETRGFSHWGRNFQETTNSEELRTTFGGGSPRKDGNSNITDNQIRKELGLSPRVAYASYDKWKPR